MKIVVEADKLSKLLKLGDISKEVDNVPIVFNDDCAMIKDYRLQVSAIYSVFNSSYFFEYEGDGETVFFSRRTIDVLKSFTGQTITVRNDDTHLYIDGEGERQKYKVPLFNIELPEFPINMKETDEGFVPENMNETVGMKINVEEVLSLPSSDTYTFQVDGEKAKVLAFDEGVFELTLSTMWKKQGEIKVSFDGEYLKNILSNFDGEIYLALLPRAMVVTKKESDYTLTYLLSSIVDTE